MEVGHIDVAAVVDGGGRTAAGPSPAAWAVVPWAPDSHDRDFF